MVFLVCLIALVILQLGVTSAKKPDSERYVKGKIYGSLEDIFRAQYSFSTFDKDGNLLRNKKIDIFLFRNFFIEFLNGEVRARIYVSASSARNMSPDIWDIYEISPELLVVKDIFGQKLKFVLNTYSVSR